MNIVLSRLLWNVFEGRSVNLASGRECQGAQLKKVKSMVYTKREDERLLSKDEHEMVSQTRHPAVKQLSDGALLDLVTDLRVARDRARLMSKSRRRELRGQTARPGVAGSQDDGTSAKRTLLVAAVKRANKETARRRVVDSRKALMSNAKRALSMKQAAKSEAPWPPASRTASEGMHPIPSTGMAPVEQQGNRPVLERSRKVR